MKVGANKEMNKSKEGEGSTMKLYDLPIQTRMELYEEVHRLRKEGLSYSKIIEEIYKKHKIRLYKCTINRWIKGRMQPLGKVNKFNDKPSPELAYIVGAMLGDGSRCYYNAKHRYQLELAVKDKEFTEIFAENLTKVLGREKSYKPYYSSSKKYWIVQGCSKLLFNFLNKPWIELKPYIEHCQECTASFLRALFDSESCIRKDKGGLILYNTNKELLNYVSYLLKKYFNIDTSLYLNTKAGRTKQFPSGKICKATKDEYGLYIHADGLMNFYKYIGFTIKRKQQRLIEAIKNKNKPPSFFFILLI